MKSSLVGCWRIVEMELWDQEFVDLVAPGQIIFSRNGRGEMHFGAVDLSLVWRVDASGHRLDFTLTGFDEGDEVSGRGRAELNGEELSGRFAFDWGDESGFVARREGKT